MWEIIAKLRPIPSSAANPQGSREGIAMDLEKYGQPLEDNPASIDTRLRYIEEELVDALMYCEWVRDKLKRKKTATFLPCVCGRNSHDWWVGPEGNQIVCKKCGLASPWVAKSKGRRAAIEAWNEMIREKTTEVHG